MFINGDGYSYTSPILAATDPFANDPPDQLLFPFMNFTCSGSITRLIFVARRYHEVNNDNNVASWPVFSLWHNMSGDVMHIQHLGPMHPNQIASIQPASTFMTDNSQEEVFMINFSSPIPFENGYILGLRQYRNASSHQSDSYIKVLRLSGGYGLTFRIYNCSSQYMPRRCLTKHQEVPYIAVDTSM